MGARKRHNKWWVDFCFNRTRFRRVSPDNTRKGAEAYEIVLKQRLARGEPIDKSDTEKILFNEFAGQWMRDYVEVNNKRSEIMAKKMILRAHLLPFCGRKALSEIDGVVIERFKARKLQEGKSNKSINNYLAVLRKMLVTAEEWSLLEKVPKIKPLKVMPCKTDYLTREECDRLLSNADGLWKDMILFAMRTGLRFGEIVALKWPDVDFSNGQITVRHSIVGDVPQDSTKSNKIRYVPMTGTVHQTLIDRKSISSGEFVFSEQSGKYLMRERCRRNLQKLCERAGIRGIGWHTLRHTFASHLAERGVSPITIKELLGHSDIKTTMRYAHLGPLAIRSAVEVLEDSGSENICHNSVTAGEIRDQRGIVLTSNFPLIQSKNRAEALSMIRAERQGFETEKA